MLRSALLCAAAVGALVLAAGGASAADKKYTFALVPKNTNNPFFDQALDGCRKAEKELGGAVQCLYIGPGEHGGGDEQAQIVADLITKRVDGIAVSPANAAAIANALAGAKAAHIPVLTWDSDLLERDKGLRAAYVGTHNYDIGVNLAKLAMQAKPQGGTLCIQSGGAAAANHNERMQGIRDTLSGKQSAAAPGERLAGQNGWTEASGCPLYTDDDFPRSIQQMEDTLAKLPNLDAFVPTGGFPQFLPDAYRNIASRYKDRIASGKIALVIADTLPVQIELLKEGLATGNVGQRPFEMGYRSMYFLKDIKDGKAAPQDPTYTAWTCAPPRPPQPASAEEADKAGVPPVARHPFCPTRDVEICPGVGFAPPACSRARRFCQRYLVVCRTGNPMFGHAYPRCRIVPGDNDVGWKPDFRVICSLSSRGLGLSQSWQHYLRDDARFCILVGRMLTDVQWAVLEPLIDAVRPSAKVPPQHLRRTISALL